MFTILVVDDNPTDRKLLVGILSSLDEALDIRQVASKKAMFKDFQKETPDLIILDIYLNDGNGLDILKGLKSSDRSSIPVIMASSFMETDNKQKSLKLGAEDFIDKPIVAEDVKARVLAQLRIKKLFDDDLWALEKANESIKILYKDLEKKNQKVMRLDKLKSDFIATVSHEIRTPIAIIKQLIVVLSQDVLGPLTNQQKTVLIKLENNTKRLERIFSNLLDISRIENKKVQMYYSLVGINDFLRDSEDFFKSLAGEKKIHLKYRLPKKETHAFIDQEKILQVLSNLIHNAIKFTSEGGEIRVKLRILKTQIEIVVIDTGIGVSDQMLPAIFDRFNQGTDPDRGKNKGLGLGLSIAKELVEFHKGVIWAESKPGVGSKFYFMLPRFHTRCLLTITVKREIRRLLLKHARVYVINFSVINYEQFQKEMDSHLKKTISDLTSIIRLTINELSGKGSLNKRQTFSNRDEGRYMLLVSDLSPSKMTSLAKLLERRFREYFWNHKLQDIFVAVGVSTFTSKIQLREYFENPSAVKMKEFYVGPQIRRHRRLDYKSTVEIVSPQKARQVAETVNVSLVGARFISLAPPPIDSRVEIKLKLLKKRKKISAKARIVSVTKVESLKGKKSYYEVGIEFISFSEKDHIHLKSDLGLLHGQKDDIAG